MKIRTAFAGTILLSGATTLAACSGSETKAVENSGTGGTGGAGAGGSNSGGTGGTVNPPVGLTGESFSLEFPVPNIASGDENTKCIVTRLGNPDSIRVGQIRNVISNSSHHLIVYRTNDTEERNTPFECTPFLETLEPETGAPLMVTQKKEDTLRLPDNVAFTLEANQMVRLELHYINTTSAPVDVLATTSFDVLAEEDFKWEADFLFIGSPDIRIPAMGEASLSASFKVPSGYEESNFFAITGHTHQWGTNVYVETMDASRSGVDTVYDLNNFSWEEPETVQYNPPFKVPTGGGFNFTCDWQNKSNQSVGFGESANQEMCFFWAYYYPSQGAKVCISTEQAGGQELCCPGSNLCGLIDDFL